MQHKRQRDQNTRTAPKKHRRWWVKESLELLSPNEEEEDVKGKKEAKMVYMFSLIMRNAEKGVWCKRTKDMKIPHGKILVQRSYSSELFHNLVLLLSLFFKALSLFVLHRNIEHDIFTAGILNFISKSFETSPTIIMIPHFFLITSRSYFLKKLTLQS